VEKSGLVLALLRVLGKLGGQSARLVSSLYTCTSVFILLFGVRSLCSFIG
jgi:hypothetical protein